METWEEGIYREVFEIDCYGMKTLDFIPDNIYDLGANIGAFSLLARQLFPNAEITAVEPNEENIARIPQQLKDDPRFHMLPYPISSGVIWRMKDAINGSHEQYICRGAGYRNINEACYTSTGVVGRLLLGDIVVENPGKYIIKCDIEGAENMLFEDEVSVRKFIEADYFGIEIHNYGADADGVKESQRLADEFVQKIAPTHDVQWCYNGLLARKKHDNV